MQLMDIRIGTVLQGAENIALIPALLKHGFESFSLTFWERIGDVDLKELAARVNSQLAGTNATLSSIGVFGNPLMQAEVEHDFARLIDAAPSFGVDIVCGFTGRVEGRPLEESFPRYAEVFGELGRRALDNGVRLAFENCDMGGTWRRGGWNIAIDPIAWQRMFNALPLDNIGLEWEPCHQMCKLADPIPQLRQWVKKIFHVHGKDATIAWDVVRAQGVNGPLEYAWHRTPGFGDCNWSDIITILRMGGFTGAIDIEGFHDPVYRAELEWEGQVRGLHYLKQCRGGDRAIQL